MAEAPVITPEQIARYYDRNTRRFLRFGGSGPVAAIHRQIWAPGVQTSAQAFLYLNRLAAEAIAPALAPGGNHVLDLGCGVGGTSTWLVEAMRPAHEIRVTGVTNSAVQRDLAERRARQLGLGQSCRFVQADFLRLPELELAQAALAIESFVHASTASTFFTQVARRLAAGARLVICDDFLARSPEPGPQAAFWTRRFQRYWHTPNLLTVPRTIELAQATGFTLLAQRDLTAYLRYFAPPVLAAMKAITRLHLPSKYWANLAGGVALQVCQQAGWTVYAALVFEKNGSRPGPNRTTLVS